MTSASSASDELVVDASAVMRLLLHASKQVASGLRRGRAVAPDLVVFEVTNALVTLTRADRIPVERAERALGDFLDLGIELVPGAAQATATLRVAVDAGVSAYDAAYLALAVSRDAVLITADRRLAALAPRAVLVG